MKIEIKIMLAEINKEISILELRKEQLENETPTCESPYNMGQRQTLYRIREWLERLIANCE
jgi:hypothetical protein